MGARILATAVLAGWIAVARDGGGTPCPAWPRITGGDGSAFLGLTSDGRCLTVGVKSDGAVDPTAPRMPHGRSLKMPSPSTGWQPASIQNHSLGAAGDAAPASRTQPSAKRYDAGSFFAIAGFGPPPVDRTTDEVCKDMADCHINLLYGDSADKLVPNRKRLDICQKYGILFAPIECATSEWEPVALAGKDFDFTLMAGRGRLYRLTAVR
jgi:hypothetical protein